MTDIKTIARNISLIENAVDGYQELLFAKKTNEAAAIIGITGAPGSGKSTLTDKLIGHIISLNKKVAVLCVDPSSPFNMGALLGDRLRMNRWYTHESVYIRSLASRKALGGLSPMIIEITEFLKYAGFDFIILETVGVGQSEIDVAGLADVTIVMLVPEGGDEIQAMKSGLMEIADIFVVNKFDRPGADTFFKNILSMLTPVFHAKEQVVKVIKTIAEEAVGIDELYNAIEECLLKNKISDKKYWLLAEKAYQLIQSKKMNDINRDELFKKIKSSFETENDFNIFHFAASFSA
jgi:LAO/AO transport system kinase